MTKVDYFKNYIHHYSAKNLDAISDMFADDITLRDWKISVSGKATAISETKKNFTNADTIDISILSLFEDDKAIAGELKIVVDKTEVLFVVDILNFNDDGKICAIKAYLGRED